MSSPTGRLRLTELLASLSLATDLLTGQPMGHGIRTCLLAADIATQLGCPPHQVRHVQQVALLRFLGCTAEVSTLASDVGGDDISFYRAMAPVLNGGRVETLRGIMGAVAPDLPGLQRLGAIARMIADTETDRLTISSHCEVAAMLAHRLGLADPVLTALRHAYERWDGQGSPEGLAGDAVPIEIRICALARDVDLAIIAGDDPSRLLSDRREKTYDPRVVSAFNEMSTTGPVANWATLISSEPEPVATIDDVDSALDVMADFADLKSPWTRGHSRRVADLASKAATAADLGYGGVERIRRSALVHDLGKVGVANGIWEKAGPLSLDEWERVRLHPYLTERILSRCLYLAPLAETASRHHEQPDGTGYHRRLDSSQLTSSDHILAAASAHVAMTSDRPHRPALSNDDAAMALETSVAEGAFDPAAVSHVLHALDRGTVLRASPKPAGLTDREVEVLRLITRERTNREIANELFISPKTVSRHIENIYTKIGVSTRAGAAVFAMENGLRI
jgi:HD-GYP domain-containing protein (c-di-GMP phosphodiesterase class II)